MWRNAAGASIGTSGPTALVGNAALPVNVKTIASVVASGSINGTIEIVHDGSPEAVVGVTTSLSGTQGISFDTPCLQRRPW